jgi:exopolysaccharide biosynthesis polyprenyl glycosylphosphotransferase
MLKENEYILSRVNIALDWLLAAGALLSAHFLRNYVLAPYIVPDLFRARSGFQDYSWLLLFLPTVTVILLSYYGHYRSIRTRSWSNLAGAHLFATTGAALAAMIVSFTFTPRGGGQGGGWFSIFTQEFVSRGVLLLYMGVAVTLLQAKELLMRTYLRDLRHRGLNRQNLLLVGSPQAAAEFLQFLRQHPDWGFQVIGLVTDHPENSGGAAEIPIVANYSRLFTYLENNVVDDVVFVAPEDTLKTLQPMLRGCEEMGIRTRMPINFMGNNIARASLETFDNVPVITFNPVTEYGAALFIKYAADRLVALLLLILLSPFLLFIALLIKLTGPSGAPVFYGQTRCGLNGRRFTLWKFRSMVPDADRRRQELEMHNEMSGPAFKMQNDPRVTPVGRWLRRSSLDELPQLWNVLRGEMSLVGPRPPLPQEVQQYDRWQRRRLSMKPGMTCIWQVSGRNRLSFDEWMEMDLQYIDNWSLGLDVKILFKTIYVVATGYGAM